LAFDRGDSAVAEKQVAAALAIDENNLLARLTQAELHCAAGRLVEAGDAYKWFVRFYNANDVSDAESLELVGLAAAQYARWNRLSDQFNFLVNELYPDALSADPAWWPARYRIGLLFLEKYNQADATRELKAALALNPAAAEVHAALAMLSLQNYELDAARRSAERALELNPELVEAHLALGDIELANCESARAIERFQKAVDLDPGSEVALGRLAGAYAVVDGLPENLAGTRVGRLIDQATERNPHCGEFFRSLARALDQSRKFPAAGKFYKQAIERMPQLVEPYGELGLVAMRLGEEAVARRWLEKSFAADPFNVRVANTRKVLEVLDDYAIMETEHFILRFDRGRDEILAKYAAAYLEEEVYPELCKRFGFEPEGKSLFEIFNRARNTGGHGWFSARMVGLPFIHTVGACAGKVVALASPNDMPKKYNWARVLKHEFVHVLNLQQTNFSIPHWFTEALAVGSEGFPRPQSWNELLLDRVPKNKLFNLDTINLGFVRPQSGSDWTMAYCQADLYAQYMTKTYGEDALAKMLAAYRDNLDTPAALRRAFQVEVADFERGYLEHVRAVTAAISSGAPQGAQTLAELETAHRDEPDNTLAAARLAVALVDRKEYPRARELAEAALADPKASQLAAYALARLRLVVGEDRAAVELLEKHLDRAAPEDRALGLLAAMQLKSQKFDEAAQLYGLGRERHPNDPVWLKSLAKVYLAQSNDVKLAETLAQLAPLDADDLPVRKKLAQLKLAAGDFDAAARWATEAIHVDCMDAEIHWMLAEANVGRKKWSTAADEYEVAVKLSPGDLAFWIALADTSRRAERRERAQAAIAKALEIDPENAEAKKLQQGLAP
jgi:Tfp pilus assembly protein PilF